MTSFRIVFSWRTPSPAPENKNRILKPFRDFSKDEDGIATVWSMFWLIICFALSGLAIDATNAWRVQQILQSTADSAALAGSIELQTVDNDAIEALVEFQANRFAALNMGTGRYGDVLINQDITVGYWDDVAHTYTPYDSENVTHVAPVNAVQTITRQNETQNHAVGTFFLRFVGFDQFAISTKATAKIFTAKCDFDGILAQGSVKLSTKQSFLDEYCVHGELGIDISQDNYFEEGTIADMADLSTCGPSEDHCVDDANLGIEDALRQMTLSGGKASKIDDYYDGLLPGGAYLPEYFADANGDIHLFDGSDGSKVEFFPKANDPLDVTLLKEDVVNVIKCPKDGFDVKLGLPKDVDPITLKNIVIVGDGCDFIFDSSVSMENAIVATNATGNQTFSGSSGVHLGTNDNTTDADGNNVCHQGGEVTLITKGSVNFASKLNGYDLEIIAKDDVHIAAKANDMGVHIGTNISAGGDVQITTGHTFHGCEGRTVSLFDPIMSWALVE